MLTAASKVAVGCAKMNSILKTYLVEDSPVLQVNLLAALEELAPVKIVGICANESDAIRWLSAHVSECDLVIIDIFLQSGSGLGVLRAARKDSGTAELVVLSNYATADMRRRCLELGASRVFDKSNEIDHLVSYCQSLAH